MATRCKLCRGPNVQTYDRSGIRRLYSRIFRNDNSIKAQQQTYEDMRKDADDMFDYVMKGVYCSCKLPDTYTEKEKEDYRLRSWKKHLKWKEAKRKRLARYYAYRYKWWQRPLVIWFDMKFEWSRV